MIESIYNAALTVWSTVGEFSVKFITANPFTAGSLGTGGNAFALGGFRGVVQGAYNTLLDIAVPIAIVFFLLALFKIVISTPPNQQIYAFVGSAVKFGIIIALAVNMWSLLTTVSQVCAGVVSAVADSAGGAKVEKLTIPDDVWSAIKDGWDKDSIKQAKMATSASEKIEEILAKAGLTREEIVEQGLTMQEILNRAGMTEMDYYAMAYEVGTSASTTWAETALATMIGFFFAILFFIIVLACSVIILITAFKRLVKPLIIAPFSLIAIGAGAGGPEASRTLSSFIRTFIGFMLSGAIMVLGFALGGMASSMISFSSVTAADPIQFSILGSIQVMLMPLVTTGIIKGADSIMSKALGL